jgi:hypothetical protein
MYMQYEFLKMYHFCKKSSSEFVVLHFVFKNCNNPKLHEDKCMVHLMNFIIVSYKLHDPNAHNMGVHCIWTI